MRQMFTWGAAVALVLVAGGAVQAQGRYRSNPYATNVYYYQMAQRQQQLYYLAAQQQRQLATAAYQQRAAAYHQQQRRNALPATVQQQAVAKAVAQAQWQQIAARELQRQRALHAGLVGPGRNLLDDYGNALLGLQRLGPLGAVASVPLVAFAPLALFLGVAQAIGG